MNVFPERLPDTAQGLLDLKVKNAELLRHNRSIHCEPDSDSPYIERAKEWAEVEYELRFLGDSLWQWKCLTMEKCHVFPLEYVAMSGAGKSRFVLHQFGKKKFFKDIPMSLVGLNFAGGASDTDSIIDSLLAGTGYVFDAMSRLLLSRGLFGVHPTLKIFNKGLPLPDRFLPYENGVMDALFQDRFPEGEGLLVVHLDELWQLKKQLHERLGKDPEDSGDPPGIQAAKRKARVDAVVKAFVCVLLEYSIGNLKNGRYILPIVTNTFPDDDLMQNRECYQSGWMAKRLCLYPFSVEQSLELLRLKREELRQQSSRKRKAETEEIKWEEIKWEDFGNTVALAGGHPSLLLNCFPALLQPTLTSEGSAMSNLMTYTSVKFGDVIAKLAGDQMQEFLTDCLLRRDVPGEKHEAILSLGAGWFQPTGHQGLVSAPFPIVVLLMMACPSFNEIGSALDTRGKDYAPTKAMGFVSALAVLLRRMETIDLWRTFTSGDAFDVVENQSQNFFSVWPISNQAAVEFGGKLDEWKILGQTNIQEQGTHSIQSLSDVMEMAWKIGCKVKTGQLTGKAHAYWVSSRMAQSQTTLQRLVHAFRVAMSGTITKEVAEAEIRQMLDSGNAELGKVTDVEVEGELLVEGTAGNANAVDVRHFIQLLSLKSLDDNFHFTHVGPNCDKQDDSILPLSELLPKGIFAERA